MSVLKSFKKVSGVFYHKTAKLYISLFKSCLFENFQTKTGKITKVGEIYNVVMQIL